MVPISTAGNYGNSFTNNIFLSKGTTEKSFYIYSPSRNYIPTTDTYNNNYYLRPMNDSLPNNKIFILSQPDRTGSLWSQSLSEWQSFSSQDQNSKSSPVSITNESDLFFEYNATNNSKSVSLPWGAVDLDGVKHTGNVTIAPWSSVIFLKDPSPDTTGPTITSFTIPSTSTSKSISITTLNATDTSGIGGYILKESNTTPQLNDSSWTTTPPTTYTFDTEGSKTLYLFVKDALGNISTPVSNTITITLPVTPPSSGGGGGGGSSSSSSSSSTNTLQDKAKAKDIKQDGSIDIFDFNIIMANWNKTYQTSISLSKGDMTGDGKIDIFDINQLMIYFGVRY
jgi:hypothetical protein